jgi:rhodanese-related sulfurtransferase
MFSAPVPTISVGEVDAWLEQGWTVLDVRNDDEWVEGHLANATHIPLPDLPARLEEVDEKVVCVCAVGGRSAKATEFLLANGREAVNLDGGMHAWLDAGRHTEV